MVGVSPVPASGVPFDAQGWQLFSSAADSADSRRAIIDFTTGNRLTSVWLDAMVQHSLDHSDRAAFAGYLPSWARYDFHQDITGSEVPIKVIVGENDPALGADTMRGDLPEPLSETGTGNPVQCGTLRNGRDADRPGHRSRTLLEAILNGRVDAWIRPPARPLGAQRKRYGMPMTSDAAAAIAASFDIEKLPPDFYQNPFPYYDALRHYAPVKRMPKGAYFLTRYDDLVAIYKDTKLFSSDKKIEFGPKFGDSLLYEHHTTSLVFNDPPLHTRIRRLIAGP